MGTSCVSLHPLAYLLLEHSKMVSRSSVVAHNRDVLSDQDKELLAARLKKRGTYVIEFETLRMWAEEQVRQQGEFESIHRDLIVGFGTWEFSPLDLENPFPNNEGSVHLWHGADDCMVPVEPQRYIAQQLPWIHYHELPGAGHLFPHADGVCDNIVKALLTEG